MAQALPTARPIRVVQFGEGKLLRGLVDPILQAAVDAGRLDGSVAIVKPRAHGSLDVFERQGCRFAAVLRGRRDGRVVEETHPVSCVACAVHPHRDFPAFLALARLESLQVVISNTTEAGIALDPGDRFGDEPPVSFPGKLTRFLFERFRAFGGDQARGLILLPTELVEQNGDRLRGCVLALARRWALGGVFLRWVEESCRFCSTLVDRIVGDCAPEELPALWERLGWRDELAAVGEPFGLWAIEAPPDVAARFPVDLPGGPAVFVDDLTPLRQRKVRILNGGHTLLAPAACLAGLELVRGCMEDGMLRAFWERAERREIVPFVPAPREASESFFRDVADRFANPFLDHRLLDIAANSFLKWRERVLPSVLDCAAAKRRPRLLMFSFAALLAFSTVSREENGVLFGARGETLYPLRDTQEALELIRRFSRGEAEAYVRAVCESGFFGEELPALPGFLPLVCADLRAIRENGVRGALRAILEEEGA